jgi:hypothetical protein
MQQCVISNNNNHSHGDDHDHGKQVIFNPVGNIFYIKDMFHEIVKYIPLSEWKKLMLLSKIHYEMIKQFLKEYKLNFISSNTIFNINKTLNYFFEKEEVENFKEILCNYEGCLSGSTVLQAILDENYSQPKAKNIAFKRDLDIYFSPLLTGESTDKKVDSTGDSTDKTIELTDESTESTDLSAEQNLNNILDLFLKKNGYTLDIAFDVKNHTHYDYFSGVRKLRKYSKEVSKQIYRIDIIYIDSTLTGRNKMKIPKSCICVDSYDYSFLKNVYFISPENKECIKIYHIYNVINKYDIRYTVPKNGKYQINQTNFKTENTGNSVRHSALINTVDNINTIEKYKKLLPIVNFDNIFEKLASRWLSSLSLLDSKKKYIQTKINNPPARFYKKYDYEKERLIKYMMRGFKFLETSQYD